MKARTKILTILWTAKILVYLFFLTVLISYSWLIDRIAEFVIIMVAYTLLRWCYPTTWHAKNTLWCMFYSITIFCITTTLSLPLSTSILSSIVLSLLLTYLLYRLQLLVDSSLNKADNIDLIYSMTEEDLRNYAKSKHISEQIIDTLILRVIHNYKWVEIQQQRNFTKDGIRYHKEQLNKKLNVKL